MCRDGFRARCTNCGEIVTCRDDYPTHEWGCDQEADHGN